MAEQPSPVTSRDLPVPLKDGRVIEMLSTGVYWSAALECYVFVDYDIGMPDLDWGAARSTGGVAGRSLRPQCRLVRGPFGENGLDGMWACACNCADANAHDALALVGYDPEIEHDEDEITYSEVLWDSRDA